MSFEEQFPSLDGSYCDFDPAQRAKLSAVCLDKTRVREVVTAYLDNYICSKSETVKNYRDGILEELGL